MQRTARAYLAVGAAFLLVGCTTGTPIGTPEPGDPSAIPPSKSAQPEIGTASEAAVAATITVASVDVDGKQVTSSGYVSGLIEIGGRCLFMFTSATLSAEAESEGNADRSTTSCGTVSVPIEQFSRGPWTVALKYTTVDGREIVSESVGLEIP